mmetsp:Transcript_37860/g.66732  ORF Transcript_37860/g.66732 Transcript_37860/m.66732 type:complete len:702 (-) Transcript_37860:137-2242(-)
MDPNYVAYTEMLARKQGLQQKRAEESQIRDQHRAALKVRKLIQKVREAKTDSFDELKFELETMMAEQIMYMGVLAQKVQEEASNALIDAQQRITAEGERLMEEQRQQFEEEMQRQEEEARIEALAEEAIQEVIEVESKVSQAEELVKPFTEGEADLVESPEGILEAANVAEEAINSARAELNHVHSDIRDKWSVKSGSSAVAMQSKLAPEFRKLHSRMAVCRRTLERLATVTRDTKGKVERAAMASKKDRQQKELWAKYSTYDGRMTRKEVSAFAEAEYELELDDVQMDAIFSRHSNGEDNIPYEKIGQLRSQVSSMKNELATRLRREEEAREKKEFEERKLSLRAVVKELTDALQAAEASAEQARSQTRPLQAKGAATLASTRLVEIASEVDESLQRARQQLTEAKDRLFDATLEPFSEDSFGRYRKQEMDRLRAYAHRIDTQIERTAAAAESGREQAQRRECTETSNFQKRAVTAMRTQMTAEGETIDQVFARVCGEGSTDMEVNAFVSLLRSLTDLTVEVGQGEALFEHIANGLPSITAERFFEFARLFYKVSRATNLSSTLGATSKAIRKLDQGEIVELMSGPKTDEKVSLLRAHCRSLAKGDEGWVTITNSQGTSLLEPCGIFFACAKAVPLTNSLSVDDGVTIRELPKGELVEAVGVPMLDESSGTVRMECKAKSDSMSGFVTLHVKGTSYLEPC